MFILERTQLIFACRMQWQWHPSLHICALSFPFHTLAQGLPG